MVSLGALKIVNPMAEQAYELVENAKFFSQENDSPHGRPWHTSFHASSFPGDDPQACGRAALYGLLDIPKEDSGFSRWLATVVDAGKDIELNNVRRFRDAGYLVRSNQSGRTTDPDVDGPQMGFVDAEHWLTGSVDMPILPVGYSSPHIVEIKTKHETKVAAMQEGMKSFDAKHRRQLLCSLGLAHENGNDFKHPSEEKILQPAMDGSIYYLARDSDWASQSLAVPTFEFYFSYNPGFMEQGRAHLKAWKEAFLDDHLPQTVERKNSRSHPFGWKWSEGACKMCPLKKRCKADYETGVPLSKSIAVEQAKALRPSYDPAKKRALVLAAWDTADPLLPA